jgi:hypothetical protein
MKFLDVRHPFLRPLWRRVALVAATLGWTAVELWGGNVFWAILFGAMGSFLAWEFFIVYDPANYEEKEEEKK